MGIILNDEAGVKAVRVRRLPADNTGATMTMSKAEPTCAERLHTALAETVLLSFYAQSAHWNVQGVEFQQYHDLFGDIYEEVSGAIDPIAENIRKVGEFAPQGIDQILLGRTSVGPQAVAADPVQLAASLFMLNKSVLDALTAAYDKAEQERRFGLSDFLAGRIDAHEKWAWQLRSSVSKAAPMKTEDGVAYPAAAYAYTPDKEKPSTWKLRLWDSPEQKETRRQIGMAVAALGAGFRGNKVEIPAADLKDVVARVRQAWEKVNDGSVLVPAVLKALDEAIAKSATTE